MVAVACVCVVTSCGWGNHTMHMHECAHELSKPLFLQFDINVYNNFPRNSSIRCHTSRSKFVWKLDQERENRRGCNDVCRNERINFKYYQVCFVVGTLLPVQSNNLYGVITLYVFVEVVVLFAVLHHRILQSGKIWTLCYYLVLRWRFLYMYHVSLALLKIDLLRKRLQAWRLCNIQNLCLDFVQWKT